MLATPPPLFPLVPTSQAECSGAGICDYKTGTCECFDGYFGNACQRSSCPNDCSGHGTCESIKELAEMRSYDTNAHRAAQRAPNKARSAKASGEAMTAAREVHIFAQLGERWLRPAYRLSASTLKKCPPDRPKHRRTERRELYAPVVTICLSLSSE